MGNLDSASSKENKPLATLGGIVGAIGGWSLSRYAGPQLFIPGLAAILLLGLFTKTPFRPRGFLGAITATGSHVVWFVVASFLAQNWTAAGLDIVLLSIGICWIWFRPGLASALFLFLVQFVSLGVNVYDWTSQPYGSLEHQALTIHGIWRFVALVCLITGYIELRKGQIRQEIPEPNHESRSESMT